MLSRRTSGKDTKTTTTTGEAQAGSRGRNNYSESPLPSPLDYAGKFAAGNRLATKPTWVVSSRLA